MRIAARKIGKDAAKARTVICAAVDLFLIDF
jgi:hypothetical protein